MWGTVSSACDSLRNVEAKVKSLAGGGGGIDRAGMEREVMGILGGSLPEGTVCGVLSSLKSTVDVADLVLKAHAAKTHRLETRLVVVESGIPSGGGDLAAIHGLGGSLGSSGKDWIAEIKELK